MARFAPVIFVETPTEWRRLTRTVVEPVAPNIVRCTVGNPHLLPRRLHLYVDSLAASLNLHFLREMLRASGKSLGAKPVLINFNYDFVEAVRSDVFGASIYYCNDEFTTWARGPRARAIIERRERATAIAADRCLTVSAPLTEKIRRWNPRTETLLPGHEIVERPLTPRREGVIRVMFMGYIDSRLHYDWLKAAAMQPDMEVHMVGPVVHDSAPMRELMTLPSVVEYGPRVGDELQEILGGADVLVLPYVAAPGSGMLAASAPNKLFTYVASAKPIVASDLPALIPLDPGVLYRATGAEEFVAAIRQAFAEDSDALRLIRLSIARENTWERRGDELRQMLEDELSRKKASSTSARAGNTS